MENEYEKLVRQAGYTAEEYYRTAKKILDDAGEEHSDIVLAALIKAQSDDFTAMVKLNLKDK